MPAYILLLIAVVPVLAMVATAGNALGRDAQLAGVIALTITLFGVITWLVVGTVRTVLEIWRRVKPNPTGSDTSLSGRGAPSLSSSSYLLGGFTLPRIMQKSDGPSGPFCFQRTRGLILLQPRKSFIRSTSSYLSPQLQLPPVT